MTSTSTDPPSASLLEAARAVVAPQTPPSTRTQATQFLTAFMESPLAWQPILLEQEEALQLLYLQLLQSKIRQSVEYDPDQTSPNMAATQALSQLSSRLVQQHLSSSVQTSAVICVSALAVRCGHFGAILSSACQSLTGQGPLSPTLALRLIRHLPLELEACALSTPAVTASLQPYVEGLLATLTATLSSAMALSQTDVCAMALAALEPWIATAHVSLSVLAATPANAETVAMLSVLVQLLSSPSPTAVLVSASHALTSAMLVPTDACTDSRRRAAEDLCAGLTGGFLTRPLPSAEDEAAVALAGVAATLVMEHVDDLVVESRPVLSSLLLHLQAHGVAKVRMVVLDVWLTVQEVPVGQRHEHWTHALFGNLMDVLVQSMQYPADFTGDWNDGEVDEEEWREYRSLCGDVLVSAYFLLRGDYVTRVATWVSRSDWQVQEAALTALTATAREVCARVKARGSSPSLSKDREQTSKVLLQLVEHLCGDSAAMERIPSTHALVVAAIVGFVGAHAPTWAVHCAPAAVLQLLAYLRAVLLLKRPEHMVPAAKAIRSILIGCHVPLLSDANTIPLLAQQLLEAALSTNDEEAMATVAEGCTRVLTQVKDEAVVRHGLITLVEPLLQGGSAALAAMQQQSNGLGLSEQGQLAAEALSRYLQVVQVIIRFCESNSTSSASPVVSGVLNAVWPFLEKVTQHASQLEYLLEKVLAIHEQLLKNVPELMAPYFQATIKYVVDIFERSKSSCAMGYMTRAVEVYGSPESTASFKELLDHVSAVVFSHISSGKRIEESTDLLRAFFELNQRFIMYCPSALVTSNQFSAIVACAVECITACQGERESTRAVLNFLAQLFGWNSLRLSPDSHRQMQASSNTVNELLAQHGGRLTQVCMATLIGGPQMIWPSCTDCLFAVLAAAATWPVPEDPASSLARQWMDAARPEGTDAAMYQQVVGIFLTLTRDGPKKKPKAKMLLTDFCKIHKGEMGMDALVSYTFA